MFFVMQILLVSTSGIVNRAFWRICIPILVYNQHLEYKRNWKEFLELLQDKLSLLAESIFVHYKLQTKLIPNVAHKNLRD